MTVALFVTLVTALSLVSSLITQALKKVFGDSKPTIIVAIVSAVIGWGGGAIAYVLLGVAFTPASILCLILLAPVIWLTATLGYDKVMEVIEQILGLW